MKYKISLCLVIFSSIFTETPFITVQLEGKLGNQLFQIAAAYAYSLDNHCDFIVPNLANFPNLKRLPLMQKELPSPPAEWREPAFHYVPIGIKPNIKLLGYFQNEKYFKHRRQEILELFAPPEGLLERHLLKYPLFNGEVLLVGVQIRDYRGEFPDGSFHPTHGREYYTQAFSLFPSDAFFVVSSNNRSFAEECTKGLHPHILYLDEKDDLIELYLLTLCDSFIISNSSFGWWAAWLSRSPFKMVVAPHPWFNPPYPSDMAFDILPPGTLVIANRPLATP